MSPMLRLVLLSCLACAWGCSVPSLEQVEQANPRAYSCDDSHPCPSSPSQVCIAGQCVVGACVPNSTQSCSVPPVGQAQCGPSLQTCAADGTFGECKPAQNSTAEAVCSKTDANCDGRIGKDTLIAQRVGLGSFQSSIILGSSLMYVTAEGGTAGSTTLGFYKATLPNGVPSRVATSACAQGKSCLSPALLTATDKTNVIAWIEQDTGGSASFTLKVGQMDEAGHLSRIANTAYPVVPSQSASNLYVTGLTLASNNTTILVLVSTNTASSSAEDTSGTRQTLMATLPLGGDPRVFKSLVPLATPTQSYGLYATASGDGNAFLVAYEDAGSAYTRVVNNSGVLDPTQFVLTDQVEGVNSPFIVPTSTSTPEHSVYFVRNLPSQPQSQPQSVIFFATCKPSDSSSTRVNCTTQSRVFYASKHTIRRARMSLNPSSGSTEPGFALLVEQDAGQQSSLSVTALPNSTVDSAQLLVNFGTFGEMMLPVSTGSDGNFLTYEQRSDTAGGLEAHLLQFCL